MTIGELFGWCKQLLEQFGVYTTVVALFNAMLVVIATGFILRVMRGN